MHTAIVAVAVGLGVILTTVSFAITIVTLVNVNKMYDEIQKDTNTIPSSSMSTSTVGSTSSAGPNPSIGSTSSLGSTPSIGSTSSAGSTPSIGSTSSLGSTPSIGSTSSAGSTPSIGSTSSAGSTSSTPNYALSNTIRIVNVMKHLNALQDISDATGGTRAINTAGFNLTLDYITKTLRDNTNFNIIESFFNVTQRLLMNRPLLSSSIDGRIENYTYSNNPSIADYFIAQSSESINSTDFTKLTVIPQLGCNDIDWQAVDPVGTVVLVKRGDCTFVAKIAFAMKYNVTAILIYNNGQTPDGNTPIPIDAGSSNTLPVLFLSNALGVKLAEAAENPNSNVSIRLNFFVNTITFPVGNICADTPTGNISQTIVVGSHSDSVPPGPGINDNGSGSAANLELALVLYQLFQTTTYPKYKYRVRFCWWGAEEVGLLGSEYHVNQAVSSNIPGERLSDYLINLNYDMLGSPNFMFGIYDGRTAAADTPIEAIPGSNKITQLFIDWFTEQNLPWDYTDFSGRSDYGPFLATGIVAGGLFSGADDIKTPAQYNKYKQVLGPILAGTVNETHDQCYHQACDHIGNINLFALEKMVQAAAHVLEYLAQLNDLQTWLYPNGTVNRVNMYKNHRKYKPEKEYFKYADI